MSGTLIRGDGKARAAVRQHVIVIDQAVTGATRWRMAIQRTDPSMIAVDGLFEVHVAVADLDSAIAFYRDVVGLRLAHFESERQVAFFWIGPAGNAMLGLWGAGPAPQKVTSHTAFRVGLADVLAAPGALRAAGIRPLDSVFFSDPDGHLLEYIAMLPQDPRPEQGIVPWGMWEQMHPTNSPHR